MCVFVAVIFHYTDTQGGLIVIYENKMDSKEKVTNTYILHCYKALHV